MSHYKSNVRDQVFNLFEVLGVDKALGEGDYADLDADTAREMLGEMVRLAEGPIAESFADADRNPPVFDPKTHTVALPDSFKKSMRALFDGGWDKIGLDEELGGMPMPRALQWALIEHILGANPAAYMYAMGAGMCQIMYDLGTDEQKKWAKVWAERRWGATMVLTEPDAGSDVGAGRTSASQQADGTWHITGVKRFITSGEHDMTDNIIHLVLARPVGAGPGTKGLSLFFVPKYHVDWDTGELLDRNGVYVTNVEHKMGLKASTTCELTFGQNEPAVGWLVGDVHDGIAQMFKVIEFARMMVGTKAIATLSAGYMNALEYTKSRVQGPDLTQSSDKSAARVTVIHHPDVRRSLMTQKAYSEGLRALQLYSASVQDTIESKEAIARRGPADRRSVNDLLLPIVKGYGSEKSYALLAESLQCFGGSGYLQDYPIEQYIRDAKIDTLYEGTTAIQGMDLFFRKIVRDKGAALSYVARPGRAIRQERVRQWSAEGRADAAGDRAGRRPGHGRVADRLSDGGSGESGRAVQGRPWFGALPDECRRSGDRLVPAAARRGGHRRARQGRER